MAPPVVSVYTILGKQTLPLSRWPLDRLESASAPERKRLPEPQLCHLEPPLLVSSLPRIEKIPVKFYSSAVHSQIAIDSVGPPAIDFSCDLYCDEST